MEIQFIKNCPCKIDGKIVHFKMASYHNLHEKHTKWMIDCGYAIPRIKVNKALKQIIENKSLGPNDEDKEIVQPKKRGRPKKLDKE